MKTSFTIFLAAFALTQITGCIEVRDKDKPENSTGVGVGTNSRHVEDFDLDEPAYLVNGQIMKEQEFRYALSDKNNAIWNDPTSWTITAKHFHLGKKAILYTLGNNLTVKAESLVGDSGQIATFPEGMIRQGRNGRNGGEILISATEASGTLSFVMRGEDGAAGLHGKDPDESKRGGYLPQIIGTKPVQMLQDVPTRGKPGYPGGDGFQGGNAGRVILQIPLTPNFKTYQECPGGKGGAYGEGGRGGDPLPDKTFGSIDPNLVGETGPHGKPGSDGLTDNNCVLLNPPAKY